MRPDWARFRSQEREAAEQEARHRYDSPGVCGICHRHSNDLNFHQCPPAEIGEGRIPMRDNGCGWPGSAAWIHW
jgi:hypothetical protein